MPVKVIKLPKGGWRVRDAGRITAKKTTKAKALRQVRLLHGIASGWKPTGKRKKR